MRFGGACQREDFYRSGCPRSLTHVNDITSRLKNPRPVFADDIELLETETDEVFFMGMDKRLPVDIVLNLSKSRRIMKDANAPGHIDMHGYLFTRKQTQ